MEPFVALNLASEPDRNEIEGLNGTGVLGTEPFARGDWHQPSPQDAVAVAKSQALLVATRFDPSGLPVCIASATVDAAPFSPRAIDPAPSTLLRLATMGGSSSELPGILFEAPTDAGEWIIRVALTFATNPGPSRQESFFRLRVHAPPPTVGGSATAPVACGVPGALPPEAYLSIGGTGPVRGDRGSGEWRQVSADGSPPNGPKIEAATGTPLTVSIEDNICASRWQIDLAPRPAIDWWAHEPLSDLIPDHFGDVASLGKANRFDLAVVPPGDWIVEASFEFSDAQGQSIGQTSTFWNVVVQ
jgi:hypothetical protein